MFTDTHCHIFSEYFNDIDKIYKNALKSGINKMINNGCDYKTNEEVLKISYHYENIFPAIGYHAQNLENYKDELLDQIENNINKIVAIGEIGLDFYYEPFDKEKQLYVFERQVQIASKYNKPVIVHSRKATEDTIRILKKYPNVKGVIHCFSGSLETANIYIKMGYKLGIGGVVTFKNSHLKDVLEKISPKNIVLETDSPYLAPEPIRGTTNEPKNIAIIASFLGKIYNLSPEELSAITENNVKEIFDI